MDRRGHPEFSPTPVEKVWEKSSWREFSDIPFLDCDG